MTEPGLPGQGPPVLYSWRFYAKTSLTSVCYRCSLAHIIICGPKFVCVEFLSFIVSVNHYHRAISDVTDVYYIKQQVTLSLFLRLKAARIFLSENYLHAHAHIQEIHGPCKVRTTQTTVPC